MERWKMGVWFLGCCLVSCSGPDDPVVENTELRLNCASDADCGEELGDCLVSRHCEEVPPQESAMDGDWVKDSEEAYTTYLRIAGVSGFSCANDGKSVSGPIRIVSYEGEAYLRRAPGHGEGPATYGAIRIDAEEDLIIVESGEKGEQHTEVFRRGERPDLCQRIEDGEEPPFEEYEDTWK